MVVSSVKTTNPNNIHGILLCVCSVIAVEAPRAWDVRLSVHPDLADDSLPLLQSLSSLQLLGRGEHVRV